MSFNSFFKFRKRHFDKILENVAQMSEMTAFDRCHQNVKNDNLQAFDSCLKT